MESSAETSILNLSSDDLARDELIAEVIKLRKNVLNEQENIEKFNQQVYDAEREIGILTCLERDYFDELEETGEDVDGKLVEVQIAEDNIKSAQQNHQERMNGLRQVMIETEEATLILEEELKELQKTVNDSNESEQMTKENTKLETDIVVLTDEVEHIQGDIEQVKANNQQLMQEINEMNNELECLKESSDYSNNELSSCKEKIETLQAEIALLRIEIESIKSVPLDACSRGNSLFAEVHDRRVHLENKYTLMKANYIEMQSEHETILKQIKCLESENLELTKLWEKDLYFAKKHNDNEIWYKEQIEMLQKSVETKQGMLTEPFVYKTKNIVPEECTFMTNYYNTKEKRIVKSLNELLSCMEERIKLAHELSISNNAAREFNLKVVQLECETTNINTDRDLLYVERKINALCNCEKQHLTKSFNLPEFSRKKLLPLQKNEPKVLEFFRKKILPLQKSEPKVLEFSEKKVLPLQKSEPKVKHADLKVLHPNNKDNATGSNSGYNKPNVHFQIASDSYCSCNQTVDSKKRAE